MENQDRFLSHHRIGEIGPLVDGCSIELFDSDGEVMANFIFSSHENARRAHKALELVMGEAFSVTRADWGVFRVSQEPKRIRIPSGDTFERKRLESLGYFIESGDGQFLVMRLDYPSGVLASGDLTQIPRKPAA